MFLFIAALAITQLFCGQSTEEAAPTNDQNILATALAETIAAQSTEPVPLIPTTEIPLQTQAISPPSQSGGITLSVSLDTKCRMGPSKDYPQVSFLLPGQTANVIGRNENNTWYYIEDPKNPGGFCWLWGEYATVQGDMVSLPVTTAEPFVSVETSPPDGLEGYTNEEYGFYLNPGGWSYDASHPNTLILTKAEYKLVICYEKQGEEVICRTGVPAGDWANGGFFVLAGKNFRKDLLVLQNKIKLASYGAGPIKVDGLTLEIWLDGTNPNYDQIDIQKSILDEVDQILSSFSLVE